MRAGCVRVEQGLRRQPRRRAASRLRSARRAASRGACRSTRTARCACGFRTASGEPRSHDRQHRGRHRRRRPARHRYRGRRRARGLPSPRPRPKKSIARSGRTAEIAVRLRPRRARSFAWLPQETILFDRARLARRIDVDLADGASLLMAEAVVFGRSAMGETVEQGAFTDRWRVRRGGRLVFAETVRLDGAIARQARRACGGRRRRRHRHRAGRAGRRGRGRARARARVFLARSAFGLERACGGAALRQGWREPAPRSCRRADRARRRAAAALAQLRRRHESHPA